MNRAWRFAAAAGAFPIARVTANQADCHAQEHLCPYRGPSGWTDRPATTTGGLSDGELPWRSPSVRWSASGRSRPSGSRRRMAARPRPGISAWTADRIG